MRLEQRVSMQGSQCRNFRGGMKGVACNQLIPEEICHLKIRSNMYCKK
jgi:hypothetical protein